MKKSKRKLKKKKHLKTNEKENMMIQSLWDTHTPKTISTGPSQGSSKREVYSDTSLPREISKKISNKYHNLTFKVTRERTNKTQS